MVHDNSERAPHVTMPTSRCSGAEDCTPPGIGLNGTSCISEFAESFDVALKPLAALTGEPIKLGFAYLCSRFRGSELA